MKLLPEHKLKSFESRLKQSSRSYLTGLRKSMNRGDGVFHRGDYSEFLNSVHAVAMDAISLIDREHLENRGIPFPTSIAKSLQNISSDFETLGIPFDGNLVSRPPAITPTFGVSLGMVFALEDGLWTSARIAKSLAERIIPGKFIFGATRPPRCFAADLSQWLAENSLSEEEEQEAMFAIEAFSQFTRRHFAKFESDSRPAA